MITAIETFKKTLDYAEAGDNVGFLLRGITRKQAQRGMYIWNLRKIGQVIAKPGSIKTGNCFEAQVYLLKEDEGGRRKSFVSGFRPQCFMRTADVAADIILPKDIKVAMPGDNLNLRIRLNAPLAISEGICWFFKQKRIEICFKRKWKDNWTWSRYKKSSNELYTRSYK